MEHEQTTNTIEHEPPADAEAAQQQKLFELMSENEKLQRQLHVRDASAQLTRELRAAGAVSPDLLSSAVEKHIEIGEDGSTQNVQALVERLRRDFPAQFAPSPAPPRPIDGGAGRSDPRPLTREALAKMTPEQIAALDWREVSSVLRS